MKQRRQFQLNWYFMSKTNRFNLQSYYDFSAGTNSYNAKRVLISDVSFNFILYSCVTWNVWTESKVNFYMDTTAFLLHDSATSRDSSSTCIYESWFLNEVPRDILQCIESKENTFHSSSALLVVPTSTMHMNFISSFFQRSSQRHATSRV